MVPRVRLEDFIDARNAHVLAAPPVSVPLTIPAIFDGRPSDARIQKPANMPPKPDGFWSPVRAPEMTISRLSNMGCSPGGFAISPDGIVPTECFSALWETHYHHALQVDDGEFRLKQPMEAGDRLAGRYFLADYMHLHHYGHFLADVVPRLWGYLWCRDVLGMHDMKLLLHPSMPDYVHVILRGLGIPEQAIMEIDQPVMVEELFVATKAFQIQDYTSPLAAALFLRIRDTLAGVADTPKRLYLSRSRSPLRMLTDEPALERLFEQRGFTVIHPQELAVQDQIALVANAELIAGPSGSNFFNLAFQRDLRASFVMVSPALLHWSDVFLQAYHRSTIHYFVGRLDTEAPSFRPGDVNAPWTVDHTAVERAVDYWIDHASPRRPNWAARDTD